MTYSRHFLRLWALAATGNEKHAETAAVINGKQLRVLGVNCVLSPVVDVASNPLNPIIGTRAFFQLSAGSD